MLLSLFQCQIRHINRASINISTSMLGGRRWHVIWRIRWSPARYWRSLWLWCCVLWRYGWLLTNRGHLRWINDWIIQWKRHRYHQWWKLIDIWVTALAIKAPVITSVATTNTLWTWRDLITRNVTQRAMSCRHRWYLCLLHWMIQSLIHLSCPQFVNRHPYLHRTQL